MAKATNKVTMVVGYPASGKSTITKDLVAGGAISLNRDTEGGSVVDLLPKMNALLAKNKSIVLDNLFATVESRKPFIEAAKAAGVEIHCKVMGTSIEDSSVNAVQRMINLLGHFPTQEEIKKSKHPNVFPIAVLFKYKKEHEKPTKEEGFDSLEVVKFKRIDDPTLTNKALILDYDGTLRECIGGNEKYPVSEEQIEIKPKRKEIIQSYKDKGYIILGASNQSGIAKGELTYEKAKALFAHTNKLLGHEDIDVSFCQHQSAPPVCYCRKPQVGMGIDFINRYKLNRSQCIFVGDYTTDKTFAQRCGFQYFDQAEFFQ